MRIKFVITIIGFLIFNLTSAQNTVEYSKLIEEAKNYYSSKHYQKSANKYKDAFNIFNGKAYPKDRYKAACSYSLAGDIELSFYHLMKLANDTYNDYEQITTDSDLILLHNDKRWDKLLLIIKSNKNKYGFKYLVDKNVTNAKEKNEKEIIHLFKEYLKSETFRQKENPYWDFEGMNIPDDFLWPLGMYNLNDRTPPIQCKIIGIFPVKYEYFALKSVFSHLDENNEIQIDNIITVYAKKIKDGFKLSSSTQYHRKIWDKRIIDNVTYYIHPEHKFNEVEAKKMSKFNDSISSLFEIPPLKFDYFTSNYSREIVQVLGHDYMPRMYRPEQTGGIADINNNIIYAGNNSEYYPHELVHLYINEKANNYRHFLIEEGIATLFGGSSGYSLEWHLRKLNEFLSENPEYNLDTIDKLKTDIPNGEYLTDFRYVVGGLICKNIYDKEGMEGLFNAMESGRTNKDFYNLVLKKLDVKKENFGKYIKLEVKKY